MILSESSPPCTSEFKPPGKTLSEEHRQKHIEGSAIAQDVAEARGYWTASRRSELPGFKGYQRRAPALVAPLYSPDGETVSAQLRPENPRLDKKTKPIKYETPGGATNILDIHPFNRTSVRNKAESLWITEGAKKGDSLTSWGRCALVLAGVWNWHLKGGEPLPCWEHVPLEGRLVYVAFDSDWRSNQNVHRALARLVAFLEDRRARVLVVDVPHTGDGKSGIDDYLAAGGDLDDLERGAKRHEPADVGAERLSRDEKLRAAASSLWDRWRAHEWRTKGDYTDRSIERALIRESEQRGTLVKDGVRIVMGKRALALEAGVSTRAPSRSITRLEEIGHLRRDNKGRKADATGAFVLLTGASYCPHNGKKGTPEEKVKSEGEEGEPLINAPCDPDGDSSSRPTEEVPELRWPTIRFRQEKDKRGRSVKVGEYVARLGKKRAAVLEYLAERGGVASIGELMEEFASPKARARDFRRDTLAMLENSPAVVLVERDVVSLVHNWRDALEGARFITDEEGDRRRQEQKHARQWEAFRRRHEHSADPEPEMPQTPDVRESWAHHPEGCACPECSERFGRVIGECVDNCRCARCYTARKEAERKSGVATLPPPRRVSAPLREAPATVVSLRPEAEDWRSHELDCECPKCLSSEPKYARPYAGRGVEA